MRKLTQTRSSTETVLTSLSGRQVDVFYLLLVTSGQYTFLPEIYDIFGKEATIKFLEVFAGCRLQIPSVSKLEVLARDTSIYVRIESATAAQRASVIHALADQYDLVEDRIRDIYAETKSKIENDLGFFAVKRGKRRG